MFKNKKFLLIFIAETIMPWIVAVFGVIASTNFFAMDQYYRDRMMEEYEKTRDVFEIFYRLAMGYGIGLSAVLFIVGLVALVIMITRISKKDEDKYMVTRPLVIWLWSGGCLVGTLLLMLLVFIFTYGQGV